MKKGVGKIVDSTAENVIEKKVYQCDAARPAGLYRDDGLNKAIQLGAETTSQAFALEA